MSVYKPKGRDAYYYDFQLKGRRFSGPCNCTNRRDAERAEDKARATAKAELDRAGRAAAGPMTWGAARDRYWLEVGQHWKGGGADRMQASLAWLDRNIGRDTLLIDIRNSLIASLVARRRGETSARSGQPLKTSTVNRSCTEPLRRVLNRAATVWEQDLPRISWRDHLLTPPRLRERELSPDEQARIFAGLRPDYHAIVAFALASGVRIAGCVKLQWSDVDWGNRSIAIRGKGERDYTIPLSIEMRAILWPLQGRHPSKVFTYVAQRTRDGRRKGEFHPVTMNGLTTEWRRMKVDIDLDDYTFHDNRHTRATRLLRKTGNLKMVQKLLGHSRIETTARYAHVTDADLMQALDAEAETKAPRTARPRTRRPN